jgi:hypothetical protein
MRKKLIVLSMLILAVPVAALAATSSSSSSGTGGPVMTAWGPRVGFSSGPDQVVFGGQLDLGNLAPDLTLTPNADIGFGDNLTTFSLSGDIHYHFRMHDSPWRPYIGGGLTFTHSSFDSGFGSGDDSSFGPNFLGGAIVPTRSGSRFFIEGKIGLTNDVADFKAVVGWNFKM